MTGRLYTTTFTVPPGTPIAAPVSLPIVLDEATLDQVDITIPGGHAGLTGLQILWSSGQIMPYNVGAFLTGDDEQIPFKYGAEVTTGGLQLVGYNTDVFPHSFLLRWHVSDLVSTSPVSIESPQATAQGATIDQTSITGLSGAVSIPDSLAATV